MPINQLAYGLSTPFTITLAGLVFSRASAFVDNTVTQYLDAHVSVKFTLVAGTIAFSAQNPYCVNVYAYGSEDGTTYGPFGGPAGKEAINGTDQIITINSNPAPSTLWSTKIGVVQVQSGAGGVAYISPPLGVAQAFGGTMPRRWGIVVHNQSTLAFATGSASYTGIFSTT